MVDRLDSICIQRMKETGIHINHSKQENYMDTKAILNIWKQSEANSAMNDIVGKPVVDENLLRQIGGGLGYDNEFSSGYFCTISGECNGGRSCWPF
jgi:hypothetical protein